MIILAQSFSARTLVNGFLAEFSTGRNYNRFLSTMPVTKYIPTHHFFYLVLPVWISLHCSLSITLIEYLRQLAFHGISILAHHEQSTSNQELFRQQG